MNKDGKIFEEESDDGIDKKTGKKRVKGKGPIKKIYRSKDGEVIEMEEEPSEEDEERIRTKSTEVKPKK